MAVEIDMSGQVALITGAAQGIGYETASLFGRAGAAVMIADLNGEAAQQAAEKLSADGYDVAATQVDVREPKQAGAAVAATVEHFGHLEVLVNNAAAWTVKFFAKQTVEEYNRDVDVCLLGTMNMCKAALEPMSSNGGGAIVNLISDAGRIGEPRLVAYSAAKAGVVGFTKALAKEGARFKVRVNGVSPGTTHTPGSDAVVAQWGGEEVVVPAYPLGRLGEPSDQGYAILFLSSPLSTWITGQILSVNGGYSMPD
ncbi:MAG TPA: SDR family NAD(P)-dependent oxidoreductase [Solirubrobacteraceae bacterium]|nr:SDR family NAD(P)-dependent oxidoreductase [Solirubrobacteraceae bacterium]